MIDLFRPLDDARAVFELWQRALGDSYPIGERAFCQNIFANPGYDPGDGLVVRRDDRVIGFCLTRVARCAEPEDGVISILIVDPAHRRQGLGAKLLEAAEKQLRQKGITSVRIAGDHLYRFWPGIPTDLKPAEAFFRSQDYQFNGHSFDLVRHLGDYILPQRVIDTIKEQGVRIEPAAEDDVAELLAFERCQFPGWEDDARLLCAVGNADHIVIVRAQGRIIGSLQTHSSASRFRSANVVWDQLLGRDVGGISAVGITKPQRGRGLGLALCAVASELLQQRGVGHCHIDWTGLVDFYAKLGFKPWRQYTMARKHF